MGVSPESVGSFYRMKKLQDIKRNLPRIDWDQEPEADERKIICRELAIEIGNVKK